MIRNVIAASILVAFAASYAFSVCNSGHVACSVCIRQMQYDTALERHTREFPQPIAAVAAAAWYLVPKRRSGTAGLFVEVPLLLFAIATPIVSMAARFSSFRDILH